MTDSSKIAEELSVLTGSPKLEHEPDLQSLDRMIHPAHRQNRARKKSAGSRLGGENEIDTFTYGK